MLEIDMVRLDRHGYFLLENVLDTDLIDQALDCACRAFELDPVFKNRYRRRDEGYGYMPAGTPRLAGGKPDHNREFWDIGRGTENRFPSEIPAFAPTLNRLQMALERIAGSVLLRLDREWELGLTELTDGSRMPIRINKYRDASEGEMLFHAHRDFSLVTLYIGATCPGLEFEIDGIWQRPEQPKGALLVAVGSILRQYRRRPRAVRHRVMATGESRLSMAMFVEPRPDVVLPNGTSTGELIHLLMSSKTDD